LFVASLQCCQDELLKVLCRRTDTQAMTQKISERRQKADESALHSTFEALLAVIVSHRTAYLFVWTGRHCCATLRVSELKTGSSMLPVIGNACIDLLALRLLQARRVTRESHHGARPTSETSNCNQRIAISSDNASIQAHEQRGLSKERW
jgi:hypothetical protein